jgi:hypothetical protein
LPNGVALVIAKAAGARWADQGHVAASADWWPTGCGDECPYVPDVHREDWPVEDPQGKSIERVRAIRDEIRARLESLIVAENVG